MEDEKYQQRLIKKTDKLNAIFSNLKYNELQVIINNLAEMLTSEDITQLKEAREKINLQTVSAKYDCLIDKLYRQMRKMKLNYAKLGKIAGVSTQTVYNVLNKNVRPRFDILINIAYALGFKIDIF